MIFSLANSNWTYIHMETTAPQLRLTPIFNVFYIYRVIRLLYYIKVLHPLRFRMRLICYKPNCVLQNKAHHLNNNFIRVIIIKFLYCVMLQPWNCLSFDGRWKPNQKSNNLAWMNLHLKHFSFTKDASSCSIY